MQEDTVDIRMMLVEVIWENGPRMKDILMVSQYTVEELRTYHYDGKTGKYTERVEARLTYTSLLDGKEYKVFNEKFRISKVVIRDQKGELKDEYDCKYVIPKEQYAGGPLSTIREPSKLGREMGSQGVQVSDGVRVTCAVNDPGGESEPVVQDREVTLSRSVHPIPGEVDTDREPPFPKR